MTDHRAGAEPTTPAAAPAGTARSLVWLTLAVAAGWVVADQLTKWWALETLDQGDPVPVVWTLQWNLVFNSGMAFSQFEGGGWIIGLVAVVIVLVLFLTLRGTRSRLTAVAVGMIIGGALGNLLDRALRDDGGFLGGRVVDFIDVQWWPVFNVADVGVVVGGLLLIIGSLRTSGP
jgi:signal peptidase II